jgi:hypothetical protein
MILINYFLQFICVLIIAIQWIFWIPYMLTVFPITGRFMHEWELFMYAYYWLDMLRHPEEYV